MMALAIRFTKACLTKTGKQKKQKRRAMKLNKSYIRQLISEQLQELKSGIQKGADAIQPEEMPGAIAGLQANAGAQEAIAAHLQGATGQALQALGQSQDPAAQQAAVLLQAALEQIADVADEGAKEASGQ